MGQNVNEVLFLILGTDCCLNLIVHAFRCHLAHLDPLFSTAIVTWQVSNPDCPISIIQSTTSLTCHIVTCAAHSCPITLFTDRTCQSFLWLYTHNPQSQDRTPREAVTGDWWQVGMLQDSIIIITSCCVSLPLGQQKTICTFLVWDGLQQQRPSGQVKAENLGRWAVALQQPLCLS